MPIRKVYHNTHEIGVDTGVLGSPWKIIYYDGDIISQGIQDRHTFTVKEGEEKVTYEAEVAIALLIVVPDLRVTVRRNGKIIFEG